MGQKLTITTWNVNGIRACYKKNLPQFVEKYKPDVLCLQETKAHIDQVEPEVRLLGYNESHWSSAIKKGYSGVATFFNSGVKDIKKGWGQEIYDSEGRIVITDHSDFLLYNIYFPNGGSGEVRHLFKQQFLKDLNSHIREQIKAGREIVVVGDYNVAHHEVDVFDPKRLSKVSGFLPEEREWFNAFLELGFIDSFRKIHPDKKDSYTWWDYRQMSRLSNRGWRIDYICVSKGLENKIIRAENLDVVEGSDHCPVTVTLQL